MAEEKTKQKGEQKGGEKQEQRHLKISDLIFHLSETDQKLLSLDSIDLGILKLLSENARMSNIEIAKLLDVSETTVRRRIDILMERGFIRRFTILTDFNLLLSCIKVYIRLKVDEDKLSEVASNLALRRKVIAIYRLGGEYNLILEVVFRSLSEVQNFIDSELKTSAIKKYEVDIVMGSYKKCPWSGI
jgi:Lrp/AsnC family transcriptional regulator for asnA, asnC and gidA